MPLLLSVAKPISHRFDFGQIEPYELGGPWAIVAVETGVDPLAVSGVAGGSEENADQKGSQCEGS
jgi:hypothetical protein